MGQGRTFAPLGTQVLRKGFANLQSTRLHCGVTVSPLCSESQSRHLRAVYTLFTRFHPSLVRRARDALCACLRRIRSQGTFLWLLPTSDCKCGRKATSSGQRKRVPGIRPSLRVQSRAVSLPTFRRLRFTGA
jgi:hypothetical protein